MAGPKRPRAADHDPPPPTLPPNRAKSSGVRTSARLAKSSKVQTSAQPATSSGVRTLTRQAKSSRSTRGKPSILPTPTETRSTTTSEHHGDGPQDASDAGSSHGSSYTLTNRELAREALKIVNNADSAELMILELMNKYSFSFTRLKELLRGKLSRSRPFCHTKSLLGLTTD
jgi:hypothetical protein